MYRVYYRNKVIYAISASSTCVHFPVYRATAGKTSLRPLYRISPESRRLSGGGGGRTATTDNDHAATTTTTTPTDDDDDTSPTDTQNHKNVC